MDERLRGRDQAEARACAGIPPQRLVRRRRRVWIARACAPLRRRHDRDDRERPRIIRDRTRMPLQRGIRRGGAVCTIRDGYGMGRSGRRGTGGTSGKRRRLPRRAAAIVPAARPCRSSGLTTMRCGSDRARSHVRGARPAPRAASPAHGRVPEMPAAPALRGEAVERRLKPPGCLGALACGPSPQRPACSPRPIMRRIPETYFRAWSDAFSVWPRGRSRSLMNSTFIRHREKSRW